MTIKYHPCYFEPTWPEVCGGNGGVWLVWRIAPLQPRCRSPPSIRFLRIPKPKNRMEDIKMSNTNIIAITATTNIEVTTNMAAENITATITINLHDFYPWYTHDEFVEVPTETAEELFADKRYNQTHERYQRRNKVLSLDMADGTEAAASIQHTDNPEAIFEMMERHCNLCCALNSLPDIQGRRIDAHYLQGKSREEIAQAEGVSKRAVNYSIESGLKAMRKYFSNNFQNGLPKCPKNVLISER